MGAVRAVPLVGLWSSRFRPPAMVLVLVRAFPGRRMSAPPWLRLRVGPTSSHPIARVPGSEPTFTGSLPESTTVPFPPRPRAIPCRSRNSLRVVDPCPDSARLDHHTNPGHSSRSIREASWRFPGSFSPSASPNSCPSRNLIQGQPWAWVWASSHPPGPVPATTLLPKPPLGSELLATPCLRFASCC